jgi:hypothetical protein
MLCEQVELSLLFVVDTLGVDGVHSRYVYPIYRWRQGDKGMYQRVHDGTTFLWHFSKVGTRSGTGVNVSKCRAFWINPVAKFELVAQLG